MKKLLFALILCLPLLVGWQSGSWDDSGTVTDFVLAPVKTLIYNDTTPDVSGYTYFNTNATLGCTITDFDGSIQEGKEIIIISKSITTYDVTTSGIKGGTTDIVTASGDVATFLYDGTDWNLIAYIDSADDLN